MRIIALISVITIFHCSIILRNQNRLTDLNSNTNHFFVIDTLTNFQASGDLKLSFKGKRFRGKADIILKDRINFELTVYNSFSIIIAYLRSDEDSVFIEIGETKYGRCLTDTLNSLSFFPPVPFNFSNLIRILTGRILNIDCLLREIQLNPGNNINFQCGSLAFFIKLSKNRLRIRSINCRFSHNDFSWNADFSRFRNGFSENIEIKSNKSDYLLIELSINKYIL